jgi:hypothetical protein
MTYEELLEEVRYERKRLRDGWAEAEAMRIEFQKMDERITALLNKTNTQSTEQQ